MNLTVEYLTIPVSLFCCCLHQQKYNKPRSFWSFDCGVLHLLLTSFSMPRKVALQITMTEHLLVYFNP